MPTALSSSLSLDKYDKYKYHLAPFLPNHTHTAVMYSDWSAVICMMTSDINGLALRELIRISLNSYSVEVSYHSNIPWWLYNFQNPIHQAVMCYIKKKEKKFLFGQRLYL